MLAYNLSPSFNWDTTGMNDEEMRRFPEELGKLGFVFNFITYGGHQIDGLAAEEFATALRQDGMLALARLQRRFRLLESPYRTPQTLVGGPRADAGLMARLGSHGDHQGDGQGLDPVPAPVQTEVPRGSSRSGWSCGASATATAGSSRSRSVRTRAGLRGPGAQRRLGKRREGVADVVFSPIVDRRAGASSSSGTRTRSTRACGRSA